jgi:4-carboxymuconolactone decarboxylase
VTFDAAHLTIAECAEAFGRHVHEFLASAACDPDADSPSAAGDAMRRRVLGDAHVDRAKAAATPFTSDFQHLMTRYVWGEIWTRPGLDIRTRRVLVLGTMIALGRWEEFEMHVRAAVVEGGFSPEDVKEIILQQSAYCGVPAAHHALKVAGQALDEIARERSASSL